MDEYFKRLSADIDHTLARGVNPEKSFLEEVLYYAVTIRGKRLRPLLFLTLLDAHTELKEAHMEIAAAIEYIHTYSLIHDDLPAMDNDDMRRGMPTVHKKFNEPIALLAGDTLLTLAFEKIATSGLPATVIVEILTILTQAIGHRGMAAGQALDLAFSGGKKEIYAIHRMKTAELIKGTLLAAAAILEFAPRRKASLKAAGISIGVAFQMADDLLDLEGEEAVVGKRLKKDEGNRSPNAVIFFGRDFVVKQIDRLYNRALSKLHEIPIEFPPFLELMKKMVYRDR